MWSRSVIGYWFQSSGAATLYKSSKTNGLSKKISFSTFPDDELESDLLHFGISLLHLAHSLGWKMWRRKSAHVMASFSGLLKKQVETIFWTNLFGHFLDSIGVALFTNIESDQEISYYSVTPVTGCISRLTQLVAKEDFVSIPQPGSLFVQSLKMKSNSQLSKECVSMSAFPPNKICIKPIHTDVYVSGVIKK